MDTNLEIKEEDSLSHSFSSQKDTEFFPKDFPMKTNNDSVLLENIYHVAVKMEIKSETPFPGCYLQKEKFLISQENHIKLETVACSSYCEINTKTEIKEQTVASYFDSQNDRKSLQNETVMKVKKYNSNHEMDNRVDIKEECWRQEIQTSTVCDVIKNEDLAPIESPRSSIEIVSGDINSKLPLYSAENLRKYVNLYMGKVTPAHEDSKSETNYAIEQHSVEKQFKKYKKDGEKTYNKDSCLKQNNVIHDCKRYYNCKICEKRFTRLSSLKRHNLIHEGIKPHKCEICENRFTGLSDLKKHYLIHDGRKLHKCDICEKKFARLSDLKRHNLIHEGEKRHKCAICERRFNRLSHLKLHNLIHEGKKQHKCEICEKRFTLLSALKRHNLIHDGRKAHKCAICNKTFTQSSHLKLHNLIHEGRKPHKCIICEKRFTQLSHLKFHILIHDGKKPHKCEMCEKSFTRLSHLKSHNLTHEAKIHTNIKFVKRNSPNGDI